MNNIRINRRFFLKAAVSSSLMTLATGALSKQLSPASNKNTISHRLVNIIENNKHTRQLGFAILNEHSINKDIDSLSLELCRSPERMELMTRLSNNELKKVIHQQHKQDFLDENIVTVQGWILSKTEAHLYAIVALNK